MIVNYNFSIAVQDDFAFEINGQGKFRLAKGKIFLSGEHGEAGDFHSSKEESITTVFGASRRFEFTGRRGDLALRLTIDSYEHLNDSVVMQWSFENIGSTPIQLNSISAPALELDSNWANDLWSMQGAAIHWGHDFAFKMPPELERENYLGHIQNGEGGGIPIVYFWNQAGGLSLAHIEPTQELWYMPVSAQNGKIKVAFEDRREQTLNAGDVFQTPRVLLSVHQGDFFEPLKLYREVMALQGLKAPEPNHEDFAPAWCSWGYEFDVRPSEVTGVLPKLRELGIHWLTLDDRWFDRYGDWNPREDTFPNGVNELKQMNDNIHAAGGLSQIWWYPLCVEDGVGGWDEQVYGISHILQDHSDWLVHNADGSIARNNRGLAMLCSGLPEVREYTAALTRKFINEWGFDGHKLDNIYGMSACYNPAHQHESPEESVRGFAEVYRQIFEISRQLKPEAVTQICPCGTTLTHTLIPATDQTVTADPTSSAQIRQRIKFYKGLMGPRAAVFADHVELSDGGVDFASCFGTGGVLATKFVHPLDDSLKTRLKEYWALTEDQEILWKKWFDISAQHSLADGEYLNLYDMAFDFPETHTIRKDDSIYYAFFVQNTDEIFTGKIQLRGLDDTKKYQIQNYVDDRILGEVIGNNTFIQVDMKGALLLKATPMEGMKHGS
ncbi:MAG: alpha-galactosidase [Anaerolineales bacterium]|uniref:alpha-galactosidase n=1 Tax=Candidatus Villigracilis proximus TaxID=3140683 RepID=UPI00313544C2|nr:alpha-galactosidase [Anaerolineales bacterium]